MGIDSRFASYRLAVPKGSALGPLLFLLCINDLNQAIKLCKVHPFADGNTLLYLGESIKNLYKLCYTGSVQTKLHLMFKKLKW